MSTSTKILYLRSLFRRAFTLIELLIVVAIIAILAAIAVPNFMEASERALRASDASNLHAIGVALQSYRIDFGILPPGDREAGPFCSHIGDKVLPPGNGPAAGGSWDGVPWVLYERRYLGKWEALFCPKYLRLYRGGKTLGNDHPRYHNFRYAYRFAASAGTQKTNNYEDELFGEMLKSWIVRDLYLPAQAGWRQKDYPNFPADYTYPWGDEKNQELVLYADMSVQYVVGGSDQSAR